MSRSGFVYLDPDVLKEIAHGSVITPSLYYHSNRILRRAFWQRLVKIDRLLVKHCRSRHNVLDFGGGSGVFLPTLANRFEKAVLLDREARDAAMLVTRLALKNVEIRAEDIYQSNPLETFDGVVAADVLEHFQSLDRPLEYLRASLKPEGVLVTSLPTENWVYRFLRWPFGITRPDDHFHTAREVEAAMKSAGFVIKERSYLPINFGFAALFHITAWTAPRRD